MKNAGTAKKLVFLLLTVVLIFSNGILLAPSKSKAAGKEKTNPLVKMPDRKKPDGLDQAEKYKEDRQVRVIIELAGSPAITYATKRGIRYKDLSKDKKTELQQQIKNQQSGVLSAIRSKKLPLKVENQFTTVANGISGTIPYGKIKELKKIENVSHVYIVNRYKRPQDKLQSVSSNGLTGAPETWNLKYKGQGMVIGVIDTGIDYRHKDMVLSEGTVPKLTQAKVSDLVKKDALPGKYFTAKVPYGYNYADKNTNIIDEGDGASMHGMHVSGIAAANGNESEGGVKGIAPEAQLLALKVYSNDQDQAYTYGDIYMKAIDDAIKLGADVLNMSFGTPDVSTDGNDPEQKAVSRAVDNGIFMSVAAGNEGQIGGEEHSPFASNPDIGTVNAPGTAPNAMSVASMENTNVHADLLDYTVAGGKTASIPFFSAGSRHPNDVVNKTYDVVDCGYGTAEDFAGKDLSGKYALMARGGNTNLIEKTANAQSAGANGAIIYNNESGILEMASDRFIKIPQISVLQADGEAMKAALSEGKQVSLTFTGKKAEIQNPEAGKMSFFSSWGTASNLDFKPEITAPGGEIYSTLNNDQYGTMSGTSMATPHVAGGAALVLQYIQSAFPSLKGADKIKRAKTLLMNTAMPLTDPDSKTFYSPRKQGAGLMQIDRAVTTPVYIVRKGTSDGKVALKEISANKFSFTLTATNFGNRDAEYTVSTKPVADRVDAQGKLALSSAEIEGATVTIDNPSVNIPKGGSKDITITIDLSRADANLAKKMKNGYFVDGFVTFHEEGSGLPDLSVPYSGFKGDWGKAPVLDQMVYNWKQSFFQISGMVDGDGYYLGEDLFEENRFDQNKIAISPDEDGSGDTATPVLSFLRNSKMAEFSILDRNKKEIRKLYTEYDLPKNIWDDLPYTYIPDDTAWDGTVNNKKVADGKYYYRIRTAPGGSEKPGQTVQIPVRVDTRAPEISHISYDHDADELSFSAMDNGGSGVRYILLFVDGNLEGAVEPDAGQTYRVPLSVKANQSITVTAYDYAGNHATNTVKGKNAVSGFHLEEPFPLTPYDSRDIDVYGTITNPYKVGFVTVEGKDLAVSPVKIPAEADVDGTYLFDSTESGQPVRFKKDGVFDLKISAIDEKQNKMEFNRKVIIDSTEPGIKADGLPDDNRTESGAVKVTVTDNFDRLRLTENGNEIFNHPFGKDVKSGDQFAMRKFSKTMALKLADGKNVFKAEDFAGNTTELAVIKIPPKPSRVDKVGDRDTKVTGSAKSGLVVEVKAGSKKLGSAAAKNGKFSVPIPKQKAGTVLSVSAKQTSTGYASRTVQVKVADETPPPPPKVRTVTNFSKKVTGTAEPYAKITVKAGKTTIGTGKAGKNGEFAAKIQPQSIGRKLYVYATDAARHTGKAAATTVKPPAPSAQGVKAGATKVTGTALSGYKVYVKTGKTAIGHAVAGKNGRFTVKIKKQKAGAKLSLYAVKNGIWSDAKTITVQK
ncbi:S8 family serine peptidase [Heyndrickxia coagulans]|uniref:S8 family serine peptidase n=1 Tax=Heyndrickxia coagulans TaxID=1398 RepID=UPI0015C5D36D|nr:S8 family serine peptidase [Heyndrickxia coagulans]